MVFPGSPVQLAGALCCTSCAAQCSLPQNRAGQVQPTTAHRKTNWLDCVLQHVRKLNNFNSLSGGTVGARLRPCAPARVAEAGNRSPPGIQLPHRQFPLIPRTGRSWHGPPSPVFLICKSVACYDTKTVPLLCDKPLNVNKLLLAPMNAENV